MAYQTKYSKSMWNMQITFLKNPMNNKITTLHTEMNNKLKIFYNTEASTLFWYSVHLPCMINYCY